MAHEPLGDGFGRESREQLAWLLENGGEAFLEGSRPGAQGVFLGRGLCPTEAAPHVELQGCGVAVCLHADGRWHLLDTAGG